MAEVKAEMMISAQPQKVWELLTGDTLNAGYSLLGTSGLVAPGEGEKYGVGAIRRISGLLLSLDEEIIYFDPPRQMDFRIVRSSIPLDHRFGTIRLQPVEGGLTRTIWESSFEVNVPFAGGLLASTAGALIHQTYSSILGNIKAAAERG